MIPDFSPPAFTQLGTNVALKTFRDLRDSLTKVNAWITYATNYLQSQMLPPLNNSTAITGAALGRAAAMHPALEDQLLQRIEALEAEVAALKERQ